MKFWKVFEADKTGVTFCDEKSAVKHAATVSDTSLAWEQTDAECRIIRDEFDDKVIALAAHLGCSLESINENSDDTYDSDDEPGEYWVLTDSEADEAFKESVENYVDECILPECPKNIRNYFDTDRFRRDVEMSDGRGPSLAGYDGTEHEEKVDGEWFFIYRVN